jgi:CBS domain containing-hemolysin-like protein
METLGRVPDEGEVVQLEGAEAEVTGVGEATVTELRFRPKAETASS